MLLKSSIIKGEAIVGSDGHLGTVADLLFDDASWKLRWLVVDTGRWLPGREVLLPISALGRPDPVKREFQVRLTRHQIRQSPDVETDLPVSRRAENDLYNYYGWDPYWKNGHFGGGAIATPLVPPLFHSGSVLHDPGTENVAGGKGDPHLRSVAAITGYRVQATDGEIGRVEDFLLNDTDWLFHYITIDTHDWWRGNRVLISPRSIRDIDWTHRMIELSVKRQKVQEGPLYNPSIALNRVYEEALLSYYGLKPPRG